MPNQLLGVLLHTIAISGLSRVRTDFFQLFVCAMQKKGCPDNQAALRMSAFSSHRN
jgi:hypothetical protein